MSPHRYRHTRFLDSVRCAGRGLAWAWATQRNLRRQVAAGAGAIGFGLLLGFDGVRLAVLWLTVFAVLGMEVLNTALEALVDALYPEFNAVTARVKDVAAGATLLAAAGSLAVGLALLWGVWTRPWPQWLAGGGLVSLQAGLVYLALPRRR